MEDSFEKRFLEDNFFWDNRENLKDNNPSIVNFSFIRNLFEKKLFHKDFWRNRKKSNLQINTDYEPIFEDILSQIRKRYNKNPSKIDELFVWGKDWIENFSSMINWSDDKTIKIKWLLTRVYRLRNNYFHWEKDLNNEENELFKKANYFMIICICSNSHCPC